jgi:hypothetical protein
MTGPELNSWSHRRSAKCQSYQLIWYPLSETQAVCCNVNNALRSAYLEHDVSATNWPLMLLPLVLTHVHAATHCYQINLNKLHHLRTAESGILDFTARILYGDETKLIFIFWNLDFSSSCKSTSKFHRWRCQRNISCTWRSCVVRSSISVNSYQIMCLIFSSFAFFTAIPWQRSGTRRRLWFRPGTRTQLNVFIFPISSFNNALYFWTRHIK